MERGDIVITAVGSGAYEVTRVGGDVIGRTNSEQEALILACSEPLLSRVWLIEPSGRTVKVDCPAKSPMENFGEQ